MKTQAFVVLAAVFVVASAVFVPPRPGKHRNHELLGAKECTYGPSYWCQNLTAAAGCHATKHCIQTVWVHKELPPDTSSVCQTCLDMVKEARDQLESNETQEMIKEVFEGSCALLHVKPIVKECDKIFDQFVPDLIDTLASEMNPQVVCSVAGLCNNEKLKMIESESDEGQPRPAIETISTCDGCHMVVDTMESKFNKMSKDQVLQVFLEVCGNTGSLADACSNIVVTYFTEMYNHLKANLNSREVCLMSGECSTNFHKHANVEITPISHIGYVQIKDQKDDLPCELCEQLVGHLRDLLIANTTELEFKKVLKGLCQQTNSFKAECLSLVDEYYAMMYSFLTNELKPHNVCVYAQLCPNNSTVGQRPPIMPLLPVETAEKTLEITPSPKIRVDLSQPGSSVRVFQSPEQAQLPIEILRPPHTQVMYNSETCVFCEYFLHYLQQVITNPTSEEKIKEYIDRACRELPSNINETCVQFVDMYEPALVAILAQEIDPSQVCPLIKACPSVQVKDVEIFMNQEGDSKCPLCLLAVTQLEEMVKERKTEETIKGALGKLCDHLSDNLALECNDFVNTYTTELIEMLIADLTPQEVCVFLKLCQDKVPARRTDVIGGDIETNLIPDNTVNGVPIKPAADVSASPTCIMCEFVMQQLQTELKDNATEEEIKNAVHGACNLLPKTLRKECNGFVNQYADTVIQLLIEATVPSEVCRVMKLCSGSLIHQMKVEIFDCAMCEAVVYAMEKILDNPTIDHNVEHVLEKACRALPSKDIEKCQEVIEKYGKTIYDLVIHLANKGLVCKEIGMCAHKVYRPKRSQLLGANKCTRGPGYWCASMENARECNNVAFCQEKIWGTNNINKS